MYASAFAENIVDLYGVDGKKSLDILRKYGKEVGEISYAIQKEFRGEGEKLKPGKMVKLEARTRQITEGIKKENNFLYVNLDFIVYPSEKNTYTTIEVVDRKHPERLRFVSPKEKNKNTKTSDKRRNDLIDEMSDYLRLGASIRLKNDTQPPESECSAFHCSWGYDDKALKPYFKKFHTGAVSERQLILDTLHKSNDATRRDAAVHLIGHFRDPHEIIDLLSPYIQDPNNAVRNSAMRVILMTLRKTKITQINPMPYLDALASPYQMDRNKALAVLLTVSDAKSVQQLIVKKGLDRLLANLELKQPINHVPAYLILKKISGKDFGSTNVAAWKKWTSSAKTASV